MTTPHQRWPRMVVGIEWIEVVAYSEPYIVYGSRGYMPVLPVQGIFLGKVQELIIAPRSLAEPLEDLREANGGHFTGIKFAIRKQSWERMAHYEVKEGTVEQTKLGKSSSDAIPWTSGRVIHSKLWCQTCGAESIYQRNPSTGSWQCNICHRVIEP